MKYALITPKGRVYTFYLEVVARQFQLAYGGQLMTLQAVGEFGESACDKMQVPV